MLSNRKSMTVKRRIRLLKLLKGIEENTEYANSLGVSITYWREPNCNKLSDASSKLPMYRKGKHE